GFETGEWSMPGLGGELEGINVIFAGIDVPSLNRLEAQLRQEFMALGAAVGEDSQVYLQRRLTEMGMSVTPQDIERARRSGDQLGSAMSRGLGRPLERLDGALANSMEAYSRIIESRERFMDRSQNPTPRVE